MLITSGSQKHMENSNCGVDVWTLYFRARSQVQQCSNSAADPRNLNWN